MSVPMLTRARAKHFEMKSRPLKTHNPQPTLQGRVVKNQTSLWTKENFCKVYNAFISVSLVAACFFSEKVTNPCEYLFDAAIHGLHACVTENSSERFLSILATLDRIRIAQLLIYPPENQSGFVTFVDVVNHGYNINVIETFE